MEFSDKDMKKYAPQKSSPPKGRYAKKAEDSWETASEWSDDDESLRRREENYLFRGYGNMLDTSEMIDFSEGADSD